MEIKVRDVPEMYSEMMIAMRIHGYHEESRNGPVLTIRQPLMVSVHNPLHRVNMDRVRRCNPFFHVMEFVWMMGGGREVGWISQFNRQMWEYAEDDGEIHAAYGWRWLKHFFVNQIYEVIEVLREDPDSRRAVIAMWDPSLDIYGGKRDIPCNTHIYLRITAGKLDMTVCNRSNDIIWGMTGANAVHMTFLQELIANVLNIPVGYYRVFTNNAHIYKDLPDVDKMLHSTGSFGPDKKHEKHIPLIDLGEDERLVEFTYQCIKFMNGHMADVHNKWLKTVALPIHDLWFYRDRPNMCEDTNWYQACNQWLQKK